METYKQLTILAAIFTSLSFLLYIDRKLDQTGSWSQRIKIEKNHTPSPVFKFEASKTIIKTIYFFTSTN